MMKNYIIAMVLLCIAGMSFAQTCQDATPGNYSMYTSKSVTYTNGGSTGIYSDYCPSSITVLKYYCSGNELVSNIMSCPVGYSCANGACVQGARPQTCQDASQGYSIYAGKSVNVTTGGSTSAYSDYCADSNRVRKYWCNGNDLGSIIVSCPNGYSCSSGACVQSASNPTCQDSTPGTYNLYAKKSITFTNGGTTTTYSDFCTDTNTVEKYWCSGNTVSSGDLGCPSGYSCSNGACAQSGTSQSCSGPSGKNLFTKSSTYYSYGGTTTTYTDYCIDSSNIMKYWCGGWTLNIWNFTCPSGYSCSDGACVSSGSQTSCSAPYAYDLYTKGTATGWDYYKSRIITTTDYCTAYSGGAETSTGPYVAKEQCLSDGRVNAQYYACPSGYSCSDGACALQPNTEPNYQYKFKVYVAENRTPDPSHNGENFDYLKGPISVSMIDSGTGAVIQTSSTIYGDKNNPYAVFNFPLNEKVYFRAYNGGKLYGGLKSPVYSCANAYYKQDTRQDHIKFYVNDAWTSSFNPGTGDIGGDVIFDSNCGPDTTPAYSHNKFPVYVYAETFAQASAAYPNYKPTPVPGATVYAYSLPNTGALVESEVTDSSGIAVFHLSATPVYFTASKGGVAYAPPSVLAHEGYYYDSAKNEVCDTYPTPSGGNECGDTGVITYATSSAPPSNGEQIVVKTYSQSNGYLVPGVTVSMYYENTLLDSRVTDSSGSAVFNLPEGKWVYFTGTLGGTTYTEYGIATSAETSYEYIYDKANSQICYTEWAGSHCSGLETGFLPAPLYPIPGSPAPTPAPTTNQTAGTTTIRFQQGWNMFSLPYANARYTTTCNSFALGDMWTYDAVQGMYVNPTTLNPGTGYWFYADNACSLTVTGDAYAMEEKLHAGWNQIGAGSTAVPFDSIKGTCDIVKGPWEYNAADVQYERAQNMEPGKAYFVKVKGDCQFTTRLSPPPVPD